jgi:DNA-binding beta-propeller fold protein YncE
MSKYSGLMAALLYLCLAGCGGSGSRSNQVVVSVNPAGGTLVLSQSFPFTATVTGATDTSVVWTCTFTDTTTTIDSKGVPTSTTTKPAPCPSDNSWGKLSDTTQTTLTYTAPSKLPTITPAPAAGTFVTAYNVILTATANADKKKFGTATITLDSGIRITITPLTATLAVGVDSQKFTASAPNETQPLKWFVTQKPTTLPSGTTFNPNPASTPCAAATCGTVDPLTGIYTPPATLPTDTTAYVLVYSATDTTRFAFATVTLTKVPTGPQTFTDISPKTAPWGGQLQDIYLIGNNLRSSTQITVNGTPVDPSQVTVVPLPASFCTPSSTVTCPDTSHVTRLRLNATNLSAISAPGPVNITVTLVNPPAAPTPVSMQLQLVQTKPAIVEAVPDSIPQPPGSTFGGTVDTVTVNGGYFGTGKTPVVKATLNGSDLAVSAGVTSRQLSLTTISSTVVPAPGLYPVAVISNPSVKPAFVPLAASNLAIQPTSFGTSPMSIPLATSTAYPSAIAVDSDLHVAAVAEWGANQVELFDLKSTGPVLNKAVQVGKNPTGIAIDNQLQIDATDPKQHLAVVANNGDSTLSFFEIPSGKPLGPALDLSKLIQSGTSATTPAPFSVGIDPFTHLALVAFNDANVGFVVQLDPKASASNCLSGHPPTSGGFCPIASASIDTGATPQIAFEPGAHLAYVSPGGRGAFSLVDLTQKGTSANIAAAPGGAVRSNHVVTITTVTPHNIDPILGGSVLISGVPVGTKGTDFNGAFQVLPSNVIDSRTFAFAQATCPVTPPAQSCPDDTSGGGVVGASGSAPTLNVTSTAVGIAINPESHVAAYADPNATSSQIGFIDSLDQVLSSALTLSVGSFGTTPGTAPELGARFVAYQPYYNVVVSLNPNTNEISYLDPAGLTRIIKAVPTLQVAIPTGTGAPSNVFGALAVDPQTNLVLVANAGSATLTSFNMAAGPQQTVQISQIVPAQSKFGVPNSFLAQATLSTTSTPGPVPAAQFIILGKGFTGATQVRLDQVAVPSFQVINDNEISFTVPATPSVPLGPSQQFPRIISVDVIVGGNNSNVTDLTVVGSVDVSGAIGCTSAAPTGNPTPSAVAIDEQRDVALVTNPGCAVNNPGNKVTNAGTVAIIDLNPTNPTYGTVISTVAAGISPTGIAVIPRLGFAVVTNQGSGTISLLDIHDPTKPTFVQDVAVGTSPSGVAINQDTGLIIAANTGDNTISTIDLTVLQETPTPGKLTATRVAVDSTPMAVVVDPARKLAVVTALQFNGIGQNAFGVLDVIDLSGSVPIKSNTKTISGLTALPTGLALDSAVTPALFYATSSLANAVYTFNPDNGASSQIRVGQGPFSVAYNPNSSELLTVNARNNTISVVDTQTFRTRATLGIGSASQFAAAIHSRTNLAVIADSSNNRVLLLPLPK